MKLTSYKEYVHWQLMNFHLVTHAMKRAKMTVTRATENGKTSVEHSMPSTTSLMNCLFFKVVELVLIFIA